ncbi:MAG TPA: hypothetical protein VGB55_08325, partial [Tepidisphaeraceae bacterium]
MQRLWEILFGLDRGFLAREGDFSLTFNPQWPLPETLGTAFWNVLLVAIAAALVVYVYRREGRSRNVRIALAALRLLAIGLVIALLNRPGLTLTQSRAEASVMAVLIDDSLSMRIKDVSAEGAPIARMEAAANLLSGDDAKLLKDLSAIHQMRLFRFESDAIPLPPDAPPQLSAEGQRTQVAASVRTVMREL